MAKKGFGDERTMTEQIKSNLTIEEKALRYDLLVDERNSWNIKTHNELIYFIECLVEGDPRFDN